MEAGSARVKNDTGRRAHEHGADDAKRITMFPEEVADARAVPFSDCGGIHLLPRMVDEHRRVVVDASTGIERTNQIVDLLAGGRRQA
jgi:hypothetical protein